MIVKYLNSYGIKCGACVLLNCKSTIHRRCGPLNNDNNK